MSRTKERRKSLERQIAELAADHRVPQSVREQQLMLLGKALERAWQAVGEEKEAVTCPQS